MSAPEVTLPFACDVCAFSPCLTPGFRQACRVADARLQEKRQRTHTSAKPSRPTPRTTIEAIVWCVRAQALREKENIERLLCCDSAARTEINERITRRLAKDSAA
jgi:hypothetical protein